MRALPPAPPHKLLEGLHPHRSPSTSPPALLASALAAPTPLRGTLGTQAPVASASALVWAGRQKGACVPGLTDEAGAILRLTRPPGPHDPPPPARPPSENPWTPGSGCFWRRSFSQPAGGPGDTVSGLGSATVARARPLEAVRGARTAASRGPQSKLTFHLALT